MPLTRNSSHLKTVAYSLIHMNKIHNLLFDMHYNFIFLYASDIDGYSDVESIEEDSFSESSGYSSVDEEDFSNAYDQPIYPDSNITLKESLLSIFAWAEDNDVTRKCLDGVLKLIKMHTPQPNKCVKSVYQYKKFFENQKVPILRKYFCQNCLLPLKDEHTTCPECENLPHRNDYFINMSVIDQIRNLYKRTGFKDKLKYIAMRQKLNENNLEDLYDGKIYKELKAKDDILSDPNSITFTWYTDGVAVFKSSKFSIWPFYLTINNLKFSERCKPENLILAGIWFGETKPVPNLFLPPLVDELTELYHGVEVEIENDKKIIRGLTIFGTGDLPAKSLFFNMTQYNGKYGCMNCYQVGESIDKTWVYRYQKTLKKRTYSDTERYALQALRSKSKEPVFGVKGKSALSLFVYKPIESTAVDIMHIFSGLVKLLINLWLGKENKDEPFSVYTALRLIDSRLSSLKPPEFVQRRPRSIEKHLKYFKASELKNFFLYYSLPIMKDILQDIYYEHHKLVVTAIFLLSTNSVSLDEKNAAGKMIDKYVCDFEKLYGTIHMSPNVHNLRHLADTVDNLGPLWTLSCFPYEDMNGKLKKLVHSSNSAQLQICSALFMKMKMFDLKELIKEESPVFEFISNIMHKKKYKKTIKISELIDIIGSTSKKTIDKEDVLLLNTRFSGKNISFFYRILKNNVLYTSEAYKHLKTKCSKFVK